MVALATTTWLAVPATTASPAAPATTSWRASAATTASNSPPTSDPISSNFGSDIITDFGNHTTGNNADLLDLSGLGITALTFTSSVGIARFGTSDTMVTVLGGAAAGGTIKLKGVNFATINQTDFRLA
jgi:hypothetical protein